MRSFGDSSRVSLSRILIIAARSAICLALAACQQAETNQSQASAEQPLSNMSPEELAAAGELKAAAAGAAWMKALPPTLQQEIRDCMATKILAELSQMRAQGLSVTKDDIYFAMTSTWNAVASKDVVAFDNYCPDTIQMVASYPL
ncbi:hypothetical protein [Dongia sp.]|jgi:hypothetical protein|uniref:hypothetical protein n=1 Tax=Dongia sp. TaxID=1977262 RepID=UPI0034A1685C